MSNCTPLSAAVKNASKKYVLRLTLLGTCAGIALAASPAAAVPFSLLDFAASGSLTNWTTTGSVAATSSTVNLSLNGKPFQLTPAAGRYMARITPSGSALVSNLDAALHLTSGTVNSTLTSIYGANLGTNYSLLSETIVLTPGTYSFYWSYAANDYKPYLDGVLFALSNASHGVNQVDVLATVGPVVSPGSTVVLGDYGATQWAVHSFSIDTSDTYYVSFAAYNWQDTGLSSSLFIGDAAGSVTNISNHPIDTNAAYYLASGLGSSVLPDFKGGTLRIDASGVISSAFTVEAYQGNAIDSYGHVGIFSGAMTGAGGLTVKDSAGGGKVVFTGANTYSGGTTIAAGGTLQIGTGTTGSIVGDVVDNGVLIFNRSNDVAFGGAISGTGSLTQAGTGALILTGESTYTGGTTISAGTLQIGNGSTTGSIVGDVTNNGSLAFNRSDDVTYAGVISGTGSLTQAGTGALILTGDSTYTGGTTISAGTLQIGNGGTTGSIVGDITNNGALAFNRSDDVTYAGVISGTGSLTKAGAGALILTGDSTYTGGTTISAGTLQIGNGGATGSIAGNISNNGSLAFNRSNSATYSGVISGTGAVSVSGGGTFILTGANTYTGQTSIAAGSTLQIGNGGTTGSIISNVANQGILAFNRSDTVTFNGTVTGDGTLVQNGTGKVIVTTNYTGKTIVNSGTLQIGNGATSGTVTGNIVNNASVVYGQSASTTYAGIISGTGSLAVAGGGVVILNGSNTYTGPTTVTAGSLIIGDVSHPTGGVLGGVTVSNGAIVGGYGSIGGNLTASGGIVSPGNSIGTLTVGGNYTQSATSTLNIEVSPTGSDKLVVGGTAQLGGTLALNLAQGDYGTRAFTLLTASNVSGTFATVTYTGASSDLVYGVVYAPKEVDLAMAPKVSGQIYGDLVTATLDTAVVLNRTVIDRLGDAAQTGWSVWSKTLMGASRTNASGAVSDFNSQLWGVISGADYQFEGGSKLSGVFAYTHNQLGVHDEKSKASTDGYFIALAGHLQTEGVSVDVSGFLQHNDIDVARDNGSASRLSGKTGNFVGGGSVQVGYPLYDGDVVPFARLTVASVGTDSFSETGSLGFAVNAVTRATVRGSWGVQLSHSYVTEEGLLLRPHALVGIESEFNNTNRNMPLIFAGTAFQAPAAEPKDVSGLVGAGVTAKLANSLEFSLDANGRFSNNQQEGIISFSAKYRF